MSWTCRGCGRQAIHLRTIIDGNNVVEMCDHPECGDLPMLDAGIPDVYLARIGQQFQNLTDDMGRPIEIQSKRHKKEVMDKLGVQEAGGTFKGARFGTKTWIDGSREYRRRQFDNERPQIRETYKRYLDNARRNRP